MKNRCILSIIINLILFLSSIIIVFINLQDLNFAYLRYFTNISGLIAGIISFIIIVFNIRYLITGKIINKYIIFIHLLSSTSELLTLITVIIFLAPFSNEGFFSMFKDDMFHFHFLNCILSFISICFLNTNYCFNKKETIFGSSFAVIYSFVYIPFVFIDVNNDFYNFTLGGKMYLIPLLILFYYLLSFISSLLISTIHNKNSNK